MSRCEHAETTVLLHLFGEAPPGYADHLAGCGDCQQSLAEHAATVDAVAPAFEDLGPPTRRRGWVLGGLGLALAAGVLLSVGLPGAPPPSVDTGLALASTPIDLTDPFDAELDLLAGELDLLLFDMEL